MGSLILLLIVTTKRIRAATIEKARQAALAEVAVPEPTQRQVQLVIEGGLRVSDDRVSSGVRLMLFLKVQSLSYGYSANFTKRYLTGALSAARGQRIGGGHGPVDHAYAIRQEASR